jgi:hypothetical protein
MIVELLAAEVKLSTKVPQMLKMAALLPKISRAINLGRVAPSRRSRVKKVAYIINVV